MAKSIIDVETGRCMLCGKTRFLECHHIINGNPGRKNSEKYGLKVTLCHFCHERVHTDQNLDLWFKRFGEQRFVSKYGLKKWMEVFHKNYL